VKWVICEHVHVNRVASPWLIKRFVDPETRFLVVRHEKVEETAASERAISFDALSVELGHRGNRCSFDAIIEKYNLGDPTLLELAKIVRVADTDNPELTPESVGLEAIASEIEKLDGKQRLEFLKTKMKETTL